MTNKLSNQKQMSELIKSIFREYDIRGVFPDELNDCLLYTSDAADE